MKTKRWMETILAQSKKDGIDMPWSRTLRADRRTEKGEALRTTS